MSGPVWLHDDTKTKVNGPSEATSQLRPEGQNTRVGIRGSEPPPKGRKGCQRPQRGSEVCSFSTGRENKVGHSEALKSGARKNPNL